MVSDHDTLFLPDSAENLIAFAAEIAPNLKTVRKRDRSCQPFDPNRIARAIEAAGTETQTFGHEISLHLAGETIRYLVGTSQPEKAFVPNVDRIQDAIELILMQSAYKLAAKAYILYRDQHDKLRKLKIDSETDLVDDYIGQLDWEVRENANMSYSLQGLNHFLASKLSKTYWLNKIYSPAIRRAHETGDLHIHDLGQLSVYCVGWDLQDLLVKGFRGAPGKVASRPPKHLRTALGQVVNFMFTLQGEAAGAQAFSSFDTFLAPFIRTDGLAYPEIHQAMQEFLFNMNVPTRVGAQAPFTNITLDLKCPAHLANEPAIVAGVRQGFRYGDCQSEMDLLNRAFFELMEEGDAEGRLFSFPIPTINLGKDFDWDNPELEPLWTMTGKYGIPYFANFIGSDMMPEETRSMCCRLRLDTSQLNHRGGGLFGASPLTGSLGVVTVNLPRIGAKCSSVKSFRHRLGRLMDLARSSLETKRKLLESLTEKGLYPYSKYYLKQSRERVGAYWGNHFSTIGLVGMNEACLNLLGKSIADPEGQSFAEDTLDFMNERLLKYQKETGNLYNLEATPAEGSSYRLALLDKQRYGRRIVCANEARWRENGEPYYTNSSHLPVGFTSDPIEALQRQDPLQSKYTGGTALHLFLGERVSDPETVKRFVRMIAENFKLPYFSLTPTFSVCPVHGYLTGEQPTCPHCGTATEVYSRVVGYLRPVQNWNDGKQAEYRERKEYHANLEHSRNSSVVAD